MKVHFSGDILHTLQYGISWFQDYASVLVRCPYFRGPDYRGPTVVDSYKTGRLSKQVCDSTILCTISITVFSLKIRHSRFCQPHFLAYFYFNLN